jgi:putative redox protein
LEVNLKWEGELKFQAEGEWGAKVRIEPGPTYGGTGKNATPMELVAMALGSCSGMDIVLILEKMKVKLDKLEILVDARRRDKEPAYFEDIKMTFVVAGDNLKQEQVERAVRLSVEKYCSVGIMLQNKANITYEIKLE